MGMTKSPEGDVFDRLNAAIQEWDQQIASSHGQLAEQIAAAQHHLDKLLELPVREDAAPPADTTPETAELQHELAAREERIAELEAQVEQLRNETQTLHAAVEEPAQAAQALQAELEARQNELVGVRAQLEEAAAAAEAEAEERVADMAAQLEAERESKAQYQAEAETRVAEMTAQLEAERETKAQYEADVQAISRLQDRLEAAERDRDAAQKKLDQLHARRSAQPETEPPAAAETAREEPLPTPELTAEGEDAAESDTAVAPDMMAETEAAPEAADEAEATPVPQAAAPPSTPLGGLGDVPAFDAQGHKKRMGQILVELGLLSDSELEDVLELQCADPQRRLGSLVVERGHTSEDVIARILAEQLRLSYVAFAPDEVDRTAATAISPHLARLHHCIPLRKDGVRLVVAMANPMDLIAIEDIELASKSAVAPVVATPSQIAAAIAAVYPRE